MIGIYRLRFSSTMHFDIKRNWTGILQPQTGEEPPSDNCCFQFRGGFWDDTSILSEIRNNVHDVTLSCSGAHLLWAFIGWDVSGLRGRCSRKAITQKDVFVGASVCSRNMTYSFGQNTISVRLPSTTCVHKLCPGERSPAPGLSSFSE